MSQPESKEAVKHGLKITKERVTKFGFRFVERKKNLAALAADGMTTDDVRRILLKLTYKNYFCGPEDDRDEPGTGQVWSFGVKFLGKEYYVKLKVPDEDYLPVKVISFHRAEKRIYYPY